MAGTSVEKVFTIKNRLGLHARAAAQFVNAANKFSSEIFVSKDGREINGKSIMGILILAAGCGSQIRLRAIGDDAAKAIDAIGALIDAGFGEDDD